MLLVLDVDDSPSVLATAHGLAIDDDVALRADDSERDHVLRYLRVSASERRGRERTHPDRLVQLRLLLVVLLVVERVGANVVVRKLGADLQRAEGSALSQENKRAKDVRAA